MKLKTNFIFLKEILFGSNEKLRFNTGNENLKELFFDAIIHPTKVLCYILSPILKIILILNGVTFGKNIGIYGVPRIQNKGKIEIGSNARLTSTNNAYNSGNLIGGCYLRTSKGAEILIGDEVFLNGTSIVSEIQVRLGSRIMIGANTLIFDTNTHTISPTNRIRNTNNVKKAPVSIEDDVWIGSNCIILKGVKIGQGSIVAAGSVVTSHVEPFSVYAGNPAKLIRKINVK